MEEPNANIIYGKKKPGAWAPAAGLAVFAAGVALLWFVCFPLQMRFGMWGLVATELILLVLAVLAALVLRWPIKEVFPLKKPRWNQIVGALLLYIGANTVSASFTMVSAYIFPDVFARLSEVNSMTSSVPFYISLITVVLLPAVCEEALNRGVLQFSLANTGKWVTVAVVGICFGIFHLDIYRFLPTAILGCALAYLRYESGSFIMPVALHFVNNLISVSMAAIQKAMGVADASSALSSVSGVFVAGYMLLAVGGVWALYGAGKLFGLGREKKENEGRTVKSVCLAASIAIVVFSVVFAAFAIGNTAPAGPETKIGYTVSFDGKEDVTDSEPIVLEKTGVYTVDCSWGTTDDADRIAIAFTLTDEEGAVVWQCADSEGIIPERTAVLDAGEYIMRVTVLNETGGHVEVNVNYSIAG